MPETQSDQFDATLREWQIVDFTFEFSLVGRIYGDQKGRFPDGRWIITSAVRTKRHRVAAGQIVQTRNTRYLLVGTMH